MSKKPANTLPTDIEVQDMVDITVYHSLAVESVGYDGMARETPRISELSHAYPRLRQGENRVIRHMLRSGDALRGIVIRKGEVMMKAVIGDYFEVWSVPTCDVLIPELGPLRFVCGAQDCFAIRKIYPEEGED